MTLLSAHSSSAFWYLLSFRLKYSPRCSAVGHTVSISVFNQLDAQNLFHNRFYFMIPEAV